MTPTSPRPTTLLPPGDLVTIYASHINVRECPDTHARCINDDSSCSSSEVSSFIVIEAHPTYWSTRDGNWLRWVNVITSCGKVGWINVIEV